ncbi:non-ribosomal peptide synthetase [Streptomyces sp. NBC_01077]|uniref:non-ribosomal peptide synthetase n=1 Tax=Streptomyces sp. NBC_01077 TaxID=2903746 RepID=UPI003864A669|nr:non-ribosomal peptide synthetase [Streptomyces sp. NBC_01077]
MAEVSVHDVVAGWVEAQPDACAVRDPAGGRELSYRELWQRAGWLAAELAGRGVRRGDLVPVAQDRSVDLIVTFLGILRCGAAYLPLDGLAPTSRLADVVAESGSGVIVRSPGADPGRWAGLQDWLPEGVEPLDVPDRDPSLPVPAVTGDRDDPAYVNFTSGSTGRPKGVVVPHRAVLRLALHSRFCTVRAGDQVASSANPAFDATTFEVWNALCGGATVVVFPSVTELAMDEWTALIRTERIDAMFLTTSLFHTVARESAGAFASVGTVVVGGEQLELGAVRRVLAAEPPGRLVNGYGPTETTTFAAYFDCTDESLEGLDRVPVGFALQETTLHLLDADLNEVPAGETGELCVGGPGVALGYLARPELTAERFVTLPATGEWIYRTGDTGRLLASGAVELFGRTDRQVKLRGFRIELEEIERTALACGLADSAFVEKIGEGPTASLVGFVLPSRDGAAGIAREELPAALNRSLGQTLPSYMLPSRWLVLDRVPFGSTGKADRAQLVKLLDAPPTPTAPSSGAVAGAPAADEPVLAALQAVWQDVLGTDAVNPTDNFIDLGGNSILAMQVATRVQQHLDVRIDAGAVLLTDSLEELAAHVTETTPVAAS